MESIMHSDGRVNKNGNNWNFEYHIKDHLGNVRVTFSDNNGNGLLVGDEIRSRNDYYPFGLEWNNRWELGDTISPLNLKRYNGKELVEDMNLGQLMFGARFLDIETGRWISPEPLVDEHTNISPYNYALNNPIKYVDPDGRKIEDIIIRGTKDDKGDAFRKATFDALQSLTNDKLQLNKDGSISIVERGTGSLAHGTELIRGLVDGTTAAGKDFDVVITNEVRGVRLGEKPIDLKTNALTISVNDNNAGNGIGTGSNIYISNDNNTKTLLKDGSREKSPYRISLSHELIHSDNNRLGSRSAAELKPYDPLIKNFEELKTINKENLIRIEHNLKLRYNGQ